MYYKKQVKFYANKSNIGNRDKSLNLSRSDDFKKYSNEFEIATKKVLSLFKCTKNDIYSEGFTRSQNYNTYFINCTDNMNKYGFAQYHLDVKTGNIYLKRDGRLVLINF